MGIIGVIRNTWELSSAEFRAEAFGIRQQSLETEIDCTAPWSADLPITGIGWGWAGLLRAWHRWPPAIAVSPIRCCVRLGLFITTLNPSGCVGRGRDHVGGTRRGWVWL
jgi:hypothetical protein